MAKVQRFAKFDHDVTAAVSSAISKYEAGQVQVQFVTTVVPDAKASAGHKVLYEAYVTLPNR